MGQKFRRGQKFRLTPASPTYYKQAMFIHAFF